MHLTTARNSVLYDEHVNYPQSSNNKQSCTLLFFRQSRNRHSFLVFLGLLQLCSPHCARENRGRTYEGGCGQRFVQRRFPCVWQEKIELTLQSAILCCWSALQHFSVTDKNTTYLWKVLNVMHMSSASPRGRTPGQPGEYVGEYKGLIRFSAPG